MTSEVEKALEEFLETIPAMPQVEHVAGIYTWTAEQYLALVRLHNAFYDARFKHKMFHDPINA